MNRHEIFIYSTTDMCTYWIVFSFYFMNNAGSGSATKRRKQEPTASAEVTAAVMLEITAGGQKGAQSSLLVSAPRSLLVPQFAKSNRKSDEK